MNCSFLTYHPTEERRKIVDRKVTHDKLAGFLVNGLVVFLKRQPEIIEEPLAPAWHTAERMQAPRLNCVGKVVCR